MFGTAEAPVLFPSYQPSRHTLSLFIIHMTHERSHLVLNIVIFLAQFGMNSVYQRTQMFIALERVFFSSLKSCKYIVNH